MSISTYEVIAPDFVKFKALPRTFKGELREKFLAKHPIGMDAYNNRVCKRVMFTPQECADWNEIVDYYFDYYKIQL
jgi:hypothetical protein